MENKNVNVVMMETNKIKPYIRNARKNDETVNKLADAIALVGFNQPIVIDKNNVIVKGHSRWKAAVKLGLDKVPCIISENDDELNKLDRLTDNKLNEFSRWDEELLATELASINIEDVELTDFGFDILDLNEQTGYTLEAPDVSQPTFEAPRYTPNYKPTEITEEDIRRTYAKEEAEYGQAVCPSCGQVIVFKK